MIKSMTAFARNDVVKESLSVATEIRSYNSRYLDIALHIPKEYYCFEERIKSIIKNQVTRGRLDVKIKISNDLEYYLRGNTLKVYLYMINKGSDKEFGIREILCL